MPRTVRLVLLHGSQLNQVAWHPYRQLFGPHVEVVTPDLPAHGARRGEPFTWEVAVDAVEAAVEEGGPSVPVVLAGHSLGGYVAMSYAARHPHRLSGLALLGASAVPVGPGAALYRAIAHLESRLGEEQLTRAQDKQWDAMLPEAFAMLLKEAGYAFDGIPAAWTGVMENCRPSLLAEVTAPVMLVNGQFDQLRIDAWRVRRAARNAAWVRTVTVPYALHVFPLTHPQATAAALWELIAAARG